MAARSLNRVQLIGNLTRDPELRYTPNSKAVVTFTIATTRRWSTNGVRKEETEFHRVVAWDKLAEICAQILVKGSKVYVEGRLHYRSWTTAENVKRDVTEIIITDMILLAGGKPYDQQSMTTTAPAPAAAAPMATPPEEAAAQTPVADEDLDVIELPDDDLPFDTGETTSTDQEAPAEAEAGSQPTASSGDDQSGQTGDDQAQPSQDEPAEPAAESTDKAAQPTQEAEAEDKKDKEETA